MLKRCGWVTDESIYISYHDEEWGVPVYTDDRYLFEMLSLEGAQAGLSWITILKRRENYREAFDHFYPEIVATYSGEKIETLLSNEGIIRNRKKVSSVINNAHRCMEVAKEFGSFHNYIWSFVDGQPIMNTWENDKEVPAYTDLSEKMSKDMKKRGFRFVGPTICYSFMQATGMVNDHTKQCFLYHGNQENND
ncbi:DNA-3-methyladenine glycosylase I [Oceanobacillus iheyensis]|uniref:DNA-3-methyladenine glycosylase I n=1 Tax=Oceanobacillus iheyensis TaxID=182710 RepID=UPI00363CB7A4